MIGLAFFLLLPSTLFAASVLAGEPRQLFGGRTVALNVLVPTIEGPAAAPLLVRTQLVQHTVGLAAPIGPAREVEVVRPANSPPAGFVEMDVELPAVRHETRFELRVEWRTAKGDRWWTGQHIALRVHPIDLMTPLRAWARKRRLRVVEDPGDPRLASFLTRHDISFEHPGAAPPPGAGPPVTLYAGKAARVDRSVRGERGAIVLFTEHTSGLAHVVVERASGGSGPSVTVEMQLLDRLETDPTAQQTFLQIFELLEARANPRYP